MHTSIRVKCKSNQDLLLFLFFVFQTLRTCLQQFRKNCLMRCWTETYKKVKYLLFSALWTHITCCPQVSMHLFWACGRETRSPDGLAAWHTRGVPSQTVYYNREAAEGWLCCLTGIFLLANSFFFLPVCQSAKRSHFRICTSCLCPNQPKWVLGISLITAEWLYFLSGHT